MSYALPLHNTSTTFFSWCSRQRCTYTVVLAIYSPCVFWLVTACTDWFKYHPCTGLNLSGTFISTRFSPVLLPFAHHIQFWLVVPWTCCVVLILEILVTFLLCWISCFQIPWVSFFVDYALTLVEHTYPDKGYTGDKFCDYACLK